MLSDSHLLRAYADHGSEEAFAELVGRYLPLVYRSALRQLSNDSHRAEDVAQLVFVALARQSRSLATHPHLSAWLHTTTHRLACQVIRTEMRRRSREQEWSVQPRDTAAFDWTKVAPVLDDAIRGLGAKDREAILLRYFSNRSFVEIGEALRVGGDAARMRVNRALQQLRDRLAKRGVAIEVGALAGLLEADSAFGAPSGLAQAIAAAAVNTTPAAASSIAAAVSLMAGSKLATASAAIAAAVAIGVSVQQWSAYRIAADAAKVTEQDILAVGQRITNAHRAGQARLAAITSAPPAALSPDERAEYDKGQQFLAAHPEVREAIIRSNRAKVRGKYLVFYRDQNLTPQQIEAFENLLIGSSAPGRTDVGLLVVNGYQYPPDVQARLRAVLGEQAYEEYHRMRLSSPRGILAGDVVAQTLSTRLAFSDEPLTPQQGSAVKDIVEAARTVGPDTNDAWRLILPNLASVLSASQMDAAYGLYASITRDAERTERRASP